MNKNLRDKQKWKNQVWKAKTAPTTITKTAGRHPPKNWRRRLSQSLSRCRCHSRRRSRVSQSFGNKSCFAFLQLLFLYYECSTVCVVVVTFCCLYAKLFTSPFAPVSCNNNNKTTKQQNKKKIGEKNNNNISEKQIESAKMFYN